MAKTKKENKKDIRQMTEIELKEKLKKLSSEYHEVIANILQGKEKNVKKPGNMKKEVARIKTFLNEKKFMKETSNE